MQYRIKELREKKGYVKSIDYKPCLYLIVGVVDNVDYLQSHCSWLHGRHNFCGCASIVIERRDGL